MMCLAIQYLCGESILQLPFVRFGIFVLISMIKPYSMLLSPKQIIYIAVSNYITSTELDNLRNEIARHDNLPDSRFIKLVEKYFDFKLLRDKAMIPEDIWLFNYLVYENKKKDDYKVYEIGEKINFKDKLLRKGLITKYETRVIMPQLMALQEANRIIAGLY